MTTPILLLILLTAPYLFARLLASAGRSGPDPNAAAAVGLGLVFLFTASGHFVQTEPMVQMLPAWVPGRVPLVYLTGVLEIAIAIGFFIPRLRRLAGLSAVAVLILFFPANIHAALNQVPMGGHAWGPVYLLVRAPVQLILVAWAWWFTQRRAVKRGSPLGRRAGAARS
ncbi:MULTISPECIES: DoxX family protein [Hydrogenophaga]|uniref:Putative membrane protein n=1 Tax=Hydrogenophaga intermedia TaxID=65786 RepID=A0A1L1PR98_HYDIT|nr:MULTISPECIES: hypothetical protein [Hydrogenophaga]AOS78559.1 hypothetical protein Q5W_06050 [Hydrogenophaga sp. PBC]CDN88566.1 putative membrane protein [Hydrogenophaga intermedia]